mmetsp:Transcript_116835/g.371890  ORF Transcript_116835/g.371890 Transcript_116835/m.371890 type:complete len:217 (-) Transcript_116835:207-857(-)
MQNLPLEGGVPRLREDFLGDLRLARGRLALGLILRGSIDGHLVALLAIGAVRPIRELCANHVDALAICDRCLERDLPRSIRMLHRNNLLECPIVDFQEDMVCLDASLAGAGWWLKGQTHAIISDFNQVVLVGQRLRPAWREGRVGLSINCIVPGKLVGRCLDGHAGAVEPEWEQHLFPQQAVEVRSEDRFGQRVSVPDVQHSVHVRIWESHHELFI